MSYSLKTKQDLYKDQITQSSLLIVSVTKAQINIFFYRPS